MSRAYTYVRNQYILGNFTQEELSILVTRGVITEEERLMIINGE
jgi:hypothetical protein